MEIVINGESRTTAEACSILELLASLQIDPARVAIEYNGLIVKKDTWESTKLQEGDKLEIVHFVGGGSR